MIGKFTCKGCTERTPGCHATCEKYLAEKAEYDKLKQAERRRYEIESALTSQAIHAVDRATKRNRKRWGNY
jgi:hypothetical protein